MSDKNDDFFDFMPDLNCDGKHDYLDFLLFDEYFGEGAKKNDDTPSEAERLFGRNLFGSDGGSNDDCSDCDCDSDPDYDD